jgi:hypothetical protein
MARTSTARAPHAARSAADAATTADPAPRRPGPDHSPTAAVLAALSADPLGRRDPKGSRPSIADTWTPAAAPATPGGEVSPAEAPGASISGAGQPADESVGSTTFRRVL